eukprot:scaffold1724_cov341-Pavlova_lutheri.AAC.45
MERVCMAVHRVVSCAFLHPVPSQLIPFRVDGANRAPNRPIRNRPRSKGRFEAFCTHSKGKHDPKPLPFRSPLDGRMGMATTMRARAARVSRSSALQTRCKMQAYICKDCGYIYRGPPAFETLPRSYRCPVCGVGKRRFVKYNEPAADGRRRRTAANPDGEGLSSEDGTKLVVGALVIAAVCAALYVGLNTVY